MTDATMTRRAFIRRASGLVLALGTGGGLVAAGARPQRAEAAGQAMCPYCPSVWGPIHRYLWATGPDPIWQDAVLWSESNYEPFAYNSSSGASGIAQFLPSTFGWASRRFGIYGSVFDPYVSIQVMNALIAAGEKYHWSETAPW